MNNIKKFLLLLLYGCQGIVAPESFTYQEIQTDTYRLASWQKISDKKSPIRIYIEGDGYAFNSYGQPTSNPTPRGDFLRKIVFNDPNTNVVYLARPCQYVNDPVCSETDWTTGRFSENIIESTTSAIKNISGKHQIILIGYSGGALLSGLVIQQNPKIPIKKWITLAGVLNHTQWTENLDLPPLKDSIDLEQIPNISQIHFIGDNDEIVSFELTQKLVDPNNLVIIPNATHNSGFDEYFSIIYKIK